MVQELSDVFEELKRRGYTWNKGAANLWTMTTIWDTVVLGQLSGLRYLQPGNEAIPFRRKDLEELVLILWKKYGIPLDSRYLTSSIFMGRINNLHQGMNLCHNLDGFYGTTVDEILVSETSTSARSVPSAILAADDLADIMRTTLRHQDIILAIGNFKRVRDINVEVPNCQTPILLNFDRDEGLVHVLRFSFLAQNEGPVFLTERILPDGFETLKFYYSARRNNFSRSVASPPASLNHDLHSFMKPIGSHARVSDVYNRFIESDKFMQDKPMTRSFIRPGITTQKTQHREICQLPSPSPAFSTNINEPATVEVKKDTEVFFSGLRNRAPNYNPSSSSTPFRFRSPRNPSSSPTVSFSIPIKRTWGWICKIASLIDWKYFLIFITNIAILLLLAVIVIPCCCKNRCSFPIDITVVNHAPPTPTPATKPWFATENPPLVKRSTPTRHNNASLSNMLQYLWIATMNWAYGNDSDGRFN